MIVDTSASIGLPEPQAKRLAEAATLTGYGEMSAPNFLEATRVIGNQTKLCVRARFNQHLPGGDNKFVPFTVEMTVIAHAAHRQYDYGWYLAQLNLSDCSAHALEKSPRQPPLFRGDEGYQIDIAAAPY